MNEIEFFNYVAILKEDNWIGIVIFFIFLLIPFIKKLLSAKGEEEESNVEIAQVSDEEKERRAAQIREYLDKMRGVTADVSQSHSAPSPYSRAERSKARAKRLKETQQEKAVEPTPILAIEAEEIAAHLPTPPTQIVSVIPKIDIIHNIMQDSRFTETQKAVIFHEIFQRPSGL